MVLETVGAFLKNDYNLPMKNFELIQSETIYQGHVFSVEQRLVHLPDSHQKTYDLVRHNNSVTLVPVNGSEELYFVRQYRIGAGQSLLELPAGVLESGEAPNAGANREMREEIGMAAGNLHKIGEFYLAPGYSSEFMHVFLATGLYSSPLEADPDEFLDVVTIPIKKAYELVTSGSLMDCKTIAALLLARPYLIP